MPEALLSVREIHTYYGDSYVLQGVSLEIEEGRIVAIVGRNGMGEDDVDPFHRRTDATSHRRDSPTGPSPARAAALRDRSGRCRPRPARQAHIQFPERRRESPASDQSRSPALRGTCNLPGTNRGGHSRQCSTSFRSWWKRIDNPGNSLSGGEQQMLAIGRALMANPDLILMDEPSEGLSPKLVRRVEEIMLGLKARGHSVLLVEQNFPLAMAVADEIHVLSSGRVVFHGTPAELYDAPDILELHFGAVPSELTTRPPRHTNH